MSFGKIELTNRGRTLWAKALAGSPLKLTKMKLGDGAITSQVIATMTDLINTKVSLGIHEIQRGNDFVTVSSSFKNAAATDDFKGDGQTLMFTLSATPESLTEVKVAGNVITAYSYQDGIITFQSAPAKGASIAVTYDLVGFYWREIGIMAVDPDDGSEVLFAYQNAYTLAEYIPGALSEIVEKIIKLRIALAQASSVTIKIDDTILQATGNTLTIIKENVEVLPTTWVEDTTYKNYPYKAAIAVTGVTAKYIPDVVFHPDDAVSGIFASIAHTGEGVVEIFASQIPSESFILPTVECRTISGEYSGSGDSGGSGDVVDSDALTDSDIATDEEIQDVVEDVFGSDDTELDESVATNEEINDVIDGIYGTGSAEEAGGTNEEAGTDVTDDGAISEDEIATDEEIADLVESVFG